MGLKHAAKEILTCIPVANAILPRPRMEGAGSAVFCCEVGLGPLARGKFSKALLERLLLTFVCHDLLLEKPRST
jgi:hypothetical protein